MSTTRFIWSLPKEADFFALNPIAAGNIRALVAPFAPNVSPITLQGEKVRVRLTDSDFAEVTLASHSGECTSETEYLHSAKGAIQAIRETSLDKVVLSTTTFVPTKFEIAALLKHLRKSHPNAFVYYFHHPEHGCWAGATPEPLVRGTEGQYTTVSLAGTRVKEQGIVPWGQKESLEQSIVTDYIRERLAGAGANNIRISRPETLPYGSIEHLCSTIRFESAQVEKVIEALHPTPAVCGTPTEVAFPLIQTIEKHQRSLYTGYIGLVSSKQEVNVFVNLRCMQLFKNGILAYTGGGLTLESDPIDEWRETRNKLRALLNGFIATPF